MARSPANRLSTQSVYSAAFSLPPDEACKASTNTEPLVLQASWKTAAVGYDVPGCDVGTSCMPSIDLPSGFRSCIYQHGDHECPASWSGDRRVVYEVTADKRGFIDARDCTPCACGAPIESLCVGQLRVFEDAACTKLISADPITSIKGQCTDVLPPGKAIGSKEISLAYLPGTCEVLGGEPIGTAVTDPAQAVTFCCVSSPS